MAASPMPWMAFRAASTKTGHFDLGPSHARAEFRRHQPDRFRLAARQRPGGGRPNARALSATKAAASRRRIAELARLGRLGPRSLIRWIGANTACPGVANSVHRAGDIWVLFNWCSDTCSRSLANSQRPSASSLRRLSRFSVSEGHGHWQFCPSVAQQHHHLARCPSSKILRRVTSARGEAGVEIISLLSLGPSDQVRVLARRYLSRRRSGVSGAR